MHKHGDDNNRALNTRRFESLWWYEPLRRALWRDPDRLTAIKAAATIAIVSVPFIIAGNPFFAVTLSLGVLAGALSETDDLPAGRIKSLGLKTVCFGISSLSVELVYPNPVMLAVGLPLATTVFILLGGLNERYRGVTFGAILVGIYALIGIEYSRVWYLQPLLLVSGALFHGLVSLAILYFRPWRPLEEQLARGFLSLSKYLEEKAALFPSDEKVQADVRNRLALHNVQLVDALERCREIMSNYHDTLKGDAPLKPYMQYFMLLQSLHEQATSSHERYEVLSRQPADRQIMEGMGQLMLQLSYANKRLANSLLTGVKYEHPVSLGWTVQVLNDQLEKYGANSSHPFALLILNLSLSNTSLRNLHDNYRRNTVPRLAKDNRPPLRRLREQLDVNHPRLRHALRLSVCFLMGFIIFKAFNLPRGEWIILTSLVVCQPGYSETRKRLLQRILGTLTGVVTGILAVNIVPTLSGKILLMICSAYAFFLWMRSNYSISVIFVTVFVLCTLTFIDGEGISAMLPRLSDTIIGSILAFASVRFLWPDWKHRRLPVLLDTAISCNARYFAAIINEYREATGDDDLPYRVARRQAHQADNALALAWQDMQVEPRKYRKYTNEAFRLTTLNHSLLSYISAFGAHRATQQADSDIHTMATAILDVLRHAGNTGTGAEENTAAAQKKLTIILENIRQQLKNTDLQRPQQIALIYNIAEVAGQLLNHTTAASQRTSQP